MRPIIIQKFGGTSLQKSDLRQAAIQHVKAMVAKQKSSCDGGFSTGPVR